MHECLVPNSLLHFLESKLGNGVSHFQAGSFHIREDHQDNLHRHSPGQRDQEPLKVFPGCF